MPDSSCMGDESRIQNVPSLADVKSHKMAHYRDRKGARWSNKPHVSLKQNDKGRGTERWHCNIPTFQLLLNWDFGRITLIRKRRSWRKFHTWTIYPTTHCVETGSAGWRAVRGRGDSRANLFPWLHLRLKRRREGWKSDGEKKASRDMSDVQLMDNGLREEKKNYWVIALVMEMNGRRWLGFRVAALRLWMDAHVNTPSPGDGRHYHQALVKAQNKASCDTPSHFPRLTISMCGSSLREELLLPRLSTGGVNNVWSQKHSAAAGWP